MKAEEIAKLIDEGLGGEKSPGYLRHRLREEGIDYTFSDGFTARVISNIYGGAIIINRQIDFMRSLNSVFYRVAFAGIAAIILLIISIFAAEGSINLNSLVGISESLDETIIGFLTDN